MMAAKRLTAAAAGSLEDSWRYKCDYRITTI